MRIWLTMLSTVCGLFGAAGVGLAAIGAHRSGNPAVTTSAFFLLFHAGALVGFCAIAQRAPGRLLLVAASMIAIGTILFSGELALHALADVASLSRLAPIGGMLMICGWVASAIALPLCFLSETPQGVSK